MFIRVVAACVPVTVPESIPPTCHHTPDKRSATTLSGEGMQRSSCPMGYNRGVKLLNPVLNDLTPRHVAVYWHYQVVRTLVDFGAAVCFLIGSILFAVKPTIDVVRSAHLNRLPGQSESKVAT